MWSGNSAQRRRPIGLRCSALRGHSYVLSPLTTDQSAIDLYLDKLDPSTVGVAGSSIANAIHQATTLLSTRKEAGDRAIIVLSDGESFEPVTAVKSEATRAGEAGISVITVGFGTPKGSTIPVRDSTGKMTLKRDKAGDTVTTVYMPEFLSAAAQSAHGTFIPADAADKAAQIRKVLDGLKTAPRTTASGTNLLGQFEWFVIPALLLLALDTLLMLRSRKRRLSIATAAAIGTMAVAACQPSGPPAPTAKQAEAAVRAKQEGARLVAYNRGTKLFGPLDKVKRDTLITSDTGLKIARDWLDSATQAKTAEVRDRALYNAGWSRIALVGRMLGLVKAPPMTKADSDSVARAQQGSAPQAAATAMAPGDSTSPTPAQADSAKKARMKDTLMAYINTARAQYKSYLVAHPDDPDAKWNYEMVLLQKQQGGGGGGGKSKPKTGKPKPGKPKPAKGKTPPKQDPPVQKFRLPPQEAKQMLQAASQREQNNSQAKPTPAAAVPGGNDW